MFHSTKHDLRPGFALNLLTGPTNGPMLLLFHGVLRNGRDFAPLWPALVPRWQVVAVDQRGHGGSSRADGYRVRDYAEDAIDLVRQCAPANRVVIYGHSLGALVAASVAAELPEMVEAIVLEDPPAASFLNEVGGTAWEAIWQQMRPLAGRASISEIAGQLGEIRVPTIQGEVRLGEVRDATSLRFSARCLVDLDPAVFEPLLAGTWLQGFDVDGIFARVRCPALILRGDEGQGGMLPRSEAVRLTGLMREGSTVDVPGVGHLVHWQAIEATTRLVLGFLESLFANEEPRTKYPRRGQG